VSIPLLLMLEGWGEGVDVEYWFAQIEKRRAASSHVVKTWVSNCFPFIMDLFT
jgi:hypothetical protein